MRLFKFYETNLINYSLSATTLVCMFKITANYFSFLLFKIVTIPLYSFFISTFMIINN
jgi:hypothetical protein